MTKTSNANTQNTNEEKNASLPPGIPIAFWLMDRKIRVVPDAALIDTSKALGESCFDVSLVKLHVDHKANEPALQERIQSTFYHELVHFILFSMGEREMTHNEKFVHMFASLLRQALLTAEYAEDNKGNGARIRAPTVKT